MRDGSLLSVVCRRLVMFVVLMWVVSLGVGGVRLEAQGPEEEVVFEGKTVAMVNLVARPAVATDQLKPLLVQQAGEPYSEERVQRTIEALKKTGMFSRVDVDVTPEAAGLSVEFVLEPAFYIGMITFPGAEGEFDYPRLLQVVNYPPQEPYEEGRLGHSEAALIRFLLNSGYFQAKVSSEAHLDPDNQIANLVFHVTLGEQARFGNVEVTGLPEPEAASLEDSLHSIRSFIRGATVKSGKSYNPDRLQAATSFLYNRLASKNRLAARVDLEPPLFERDTNSSDVSFRVTPGPRVNIETEGTGISRRNLRRLVPIYEENTFDQDLVEEGRQNLVSHFQSKGYFDATVVTDLMQPSAPAASIDLTYHIHRGERYRVTEVAFSGNRYYTDEDLLTQVPIRTARFLSRGSFSNKLLAQSVESLMSYYQDAGFTDAEVAPEVDNRERQIRVRFNITEGPQTVVDAIHVIGNITQTRSTLAPKGLNLLGGMPFSRRRLNEDRNQIMATYLDLGYLSATFQSTVTPLPDDPHRMDVVFTIFEGPRVYISRVLNLGAVQTENSFVDLVSQVRAGNHFSQGRLLTAESDLYNTGLFNWVNIDSRRPITDQNEEAVLIRVHEAKRNTIAYGLGYDLSPRVGNIPAGTVALPGSVLVDLPDTFETTQESFSSPRASVEYTRRNMRGRGETLTLTTRFARLDQRAAIGYTVPHFRSYNWQSLISLSGERSSDNPLFTAQLGGATFQVERPLNYVKTQTIYLRYTYNLTKLTEILIPELVLEEDRFVYLSTLSATYVRDTRDMPLDAHTGIYQSFDLGLTPRVLGSSANFVRFLGQTAYYRPVKPWLVWANDIRVGALKSFGGSVVPLSSRFFSGGADSLRGFPFQGAGPQRVVPVCSDPADLASCTNITVPVGGNAVFIVNSELRFPIPIKKSFEGVVFYDGGNVYQAIGIAHIANDFSNTIGFGIRYKTKVGPIRFDIGHNLHPKAGLEATQYFITLGQAF